MKKEELLKQCRFFRGGGDEEAHAIYDKPYEFIVCWTGEELWVRNGGKITKEERWIKPIVSELAPELPLELRVYLCVSFMHFGNGGIYEDVPALVKSLRDEIYPFYMGSQVIS